MLHCPDQGDGEYAADPTYGKSMSCRQLIYMWVEGEIFVKYYSKDSKQILLG